MTKPLILALDQGTTSSRAIVFDDQAAIVAVAQEEFPQIFPREGWVEHDLEDIWRTTLRTAKRAVEDAEAKGGVVVAIGVTNQRETTCLWEKDSLKPVANAIVWQDRRTADICRDLKQNGAEELVQERTGLLLDPYFSATKLAYLLDNVGGARAAAEAGKLAFGTVDAFLLARLTGGRHATDATNASRTSLFNIHTNEWDQSLLELFKAPAACLPHVCDTMDEFGETDPSHFGRAIPIYAMVGDQQAAAVGQGCFEPGDVKSTYGTGCFILAETGESARPSQNRLLTTISRRINGKAYYALEGSIFVAGAAVQWLRDQLKIVDNAAQTEELARSIPSSGGVYLVPAFAGLGAPHWAADARGVLTGLTRGSGRREIARATLESVAYQTADLLDAMAADGAVVETLKVDGGMVANNWLMQFLSDILHRPVERPTVLETTALGSAYLAGVKAGIYDDFETFRRDRQRDAIFTPSLGEEARNALRNGWRVALNQTLSATEN